MQRFPFEFFTFKSVFVIVTLRISERAGMRSVLFLFIVTGTGTGKRLRIVQMLCCPSTKSPAHIPSRLVYLEIFCACSRINYIMRTTILILLVKWGRGGPFSVPHIVKGVFKA